MTARKFALATNWVLDAPLCHVWALIERTENWPDWWRAVRRVELLRAGTSDGLGAVRRINWATALPYQITFDVELMRVEHHWLIEGRAFGELDGTGLWTFTAEGEARTHVRYDWRVAVTKRWMIALAPVLRPVFAWNHNKVMAWGEEGARKALRPPVT